MVGYPIVDDFMIFGSPYQHGEEEKKTKAGIGKTAGCRRGIQIP
jgi:hypothetical protein